MGNILGHFNRKYRKIIFKILDPNIRDLLQVSIIVAVVGSIMYYVIHLPGETLFTYAKVLGYIASALVLLQWTPQIITTFRAKVTFASRIAI